MYDSQLFRLNIKGIKTEFDEKNNLLKLTIVPFVDYKSEKKLPFEVSKLLEKKAETVITLDFSKSFDSDSHKNIYSLLHDLSRIQWFKTKNVIIEQLQSYLIQRIQLNCKTNLFADTIRLKVNNRIFVQLIQITF